MSYQDIIAAFVIGLFIGSGEIFGGVCIGIIYSTFLRDDKESD